MRDRTGPRQLTRAQCCVDLQAVKEVEPEDDSLAARTQEDVQKSKELLV